MRERGKDPRADGEARVRISDTRSRSCSCRKGSHGKKSGYAELNLNVDGRQC